MTREEVKKTLADTHALADKIMKRQPARPVKKIKRPRAVSTPTPTLKRARSNHTQPAGSRARSTLPPTVVKVDDGIPAAIIELAGAVAKLAGRSQPAPQVTVPVNVEVDATPAPLRTVVKQRDKDGLIVETEQSPV